MKFNALNYVKLILLSCILPGAMLTACNNSNKSEKTSTSDTSVSSTQPVNPDTTKLKRVGKVGMIMAVKDNNAKIKVDKQGYYNYAEVQPVYPGGQSSLESYINNNIQYPEDAIDNNVEGTVNVQFTIDENGTVGNVKAEGAKLGHGLEEAAVKAVSAMPKWEPGKVKGKNVKAWYTLPVTFKIEG